jgi:hypothetical protein
MVLQTICACKEKMKLDELISNISNKTKENKIFDIELFEIIRPRILLYDEKIYKNYNITYKERLKLIILKIKNKTFKYLSRLQCNKLNISCQVLVLGFSNNHYFTNLKPVIDELKITTFSISDRLFNQEELKSVWKYYKNIPKQQINKIKKEFKIFKELILSDIFINSISEGEKEAEKIKIKKYLQYNVIYDIERLLELFIVTYYLLEKLRPIKVITSDEIDQRCRFVLLAAKKLGIETLCIQQGATSKNYKEWDNVISNKFFVFGEETKKILLDQAVNKNKIHVVGNPSYDNLPSKVIDNGVYLLASQPYYEGSFANKEIRQQMLFDLIDIFINNPKLQLTIKTHPFEEKKEWNWITNKYKNINVVKKIDLSKEISECGIFITFYSTCTYEAIIHNKTIICMQYNGSINLKVPFLEPEVKIARNKFDLNELIILNSNEKYRMKSELINLNLRQDFISKNLYLIDKKASKRIANYINEVE